MEDDTSLTFEFDLTEVTVIAVSLGQISSLFPQDKELRKFAYEFINQLKQADRMVIKMELLDFTTILAHLLLFNKNILHNQLLEQVCNNLQNQILEKSTPESTLDAINENNLRILLRKAGIQ